MQMRKRTVCTKAAGKGLTNHSQQRYDRQYVASSHDESFALRKLLLAEPT